MLVVGDSYQELLVVLAPNGPNRPNQAEDKTGSTINRANRRSRAPLCQTGEHMHEIQSGIQSELHGETQKRATLHTFSYPPPGRSPSQDGSQKVANKLKIAISQISNQLNF